MTVLEAPELGARPASPEAARLCVLGSFQLRQKRQLVDLQPAARRLLAFLSLHDRALQRSYVAGCLWPDHDEEHANGNLRTTVWRMRRAGLDVLDTRDGCLALNEWVSVDLRIVVDRAHRLLHPASSTNGAAEDLTAFADDLLPDWWEDWLVVERERHRQLRLHALERLAETLLAKGHTPQAIEAALVAVQGEPLRESAHRLVIRAHLAEGNASEALRAYRSCARLLRSELGVEPSPLMQALVRTLGLAPVDDP